MLWSFNLCNPVHPVNRVRDEVRRRKMMQIPYPHPECPPDPGCVAGIRTPKFSNTPGVRRTPGVLR